MTVDRKLGAGGFAEVWLARCAPAVAKNGRCVLKRARVDASNADGLSLARRELSVLRVLPRSRYLVGALASEETRERDERGGGEFVRFDILMEELGENCQEEAARHAGRAEPLLERTLLCRFRDLGGALLALHGASIVHFDVKLENLLLRRAEGRRRRRGGGGGGLSSQAEAGDFSETAAALCDFGSARVGGLECGGARLAAAEDFIERATTMAYRAPELCDPRAFRAARVGPSADVWAAGVALFKLAFLRLPFEESKLAVLNSAFATPTGSPYSPGFHQLLRGALTKDPAARPPISALLQDAGALASWPGAGAGGAGVEEGGAEEEEEGEGSDEEGGGGAPAASARSGKGVVALAARAVASALALAHERALQAVGSRERLLLKATSPFPGPPKAKYVRRLVVDAWEARSGGGAAALEWLPARLGASSAAVVVLKCACVALRVVAEGPPSAGEAAARGALRRALLHHAPRGEWASAAGAAEDALRGAGAVDALGALMCGLVVEKLRACGGSASQPVKHTNPLRGGAEASDPLRGLGGDWRAGGALVGALRGGGSGGGGGGGGVGGAAGGARAAAAAALALAPLLEGAARVGSAASARGARAASAAAAASARGGGGEGSGEGGGGGEGAAAVAACLLGALPYITAEVLSMLEALAALSALGLLSVGSAEGARVAAAAAAAGACFAGARAVAAAPGLGEAMGAACAAPALPAGGGLPFSSAPATLVYLQFVAGGGLGGGAAQPPPSPPADEESAPPAAGAAAPPEDCFSFPPEQQGAGWSGLDDFFGAAAPAPRAARGPAAPSGTSGDADPFSLEDGSDLLQF